MVKHEKDWDGSEWLVCKRCGHKEDDVYTVLCYKTKYPGIPTHDIPYECGACIDLEKEE